MGTFYNSSLCLGLESKYAGYGNPLGFSLPSLQPMPGTN